MCVCVYSKIVSILIAVVSWSYVSVRNVVHNKSKKVLVLIDNNNKKIKYINVSMSKFGNRLKG